jgi:2-oxoglutarate ferredoxin oxidoreductase subunit alpha
MTQDLCLVISGEAGQGLQTIEELLVRTISKDYFVCSSKDIMSRVRGGNNSTEIRITSKNTFAYKETIDLLFLLNDHALTRLLPRIREQTVIFAEDSFVDQNHLPVDAEQFYPVPLSDLAKEAGGKLYTNTVLVGFITAILDLNNKIALGLIAEKFASKDQAIIDNNISAFEMGYGAGVASDYTCVEIENVENITEPSSYAILDGTESIAIGALAGGCNYVSSYPMSPSTGVLIYLAQKAKEMDILVEQAEDEIAALNMVLGAWYAGAKGLATTSGGGLALMQEAISLSGITETPCVIHVAQRTGPATGLPTRTEQADLNLVLYAGHGEFPRIVLAPGSLTEGIELTQKAFSLADAYQVPVFVLTDQFFVDSLGMMKRFILENQLEETHIQKTDENYKRYLLTEDGISPRGIPGWGTGFVKVDSDEHTEEGIITEDFKMRVSMNDKRLKKRERILEEYIEEEWYGEKNAPKVIVAWGSTHSAVEEWFEQKKDPEVAYLHLKQLYPLPTRLRKQLVDKTICCIEGNAAGQLANLLRTELDITVDQKINKYDGAPFSVEYIEDKWNEVNHG